MNSKEFDLVVIGAGPGGYVAAIKGAQSGLRTALVEKDSRLGGTCLLRGCIPTKAMIQSAAAYELCRKGARTFGVKVEGAAVDWAAARKRKDMVVKKGSMGVGMLMQKHGVEVIQGHGRLAGPGRIKVEREGDETLNLKAGRIILATGSTTADVPGIDVDGERILNSDHLLEIDAVPESLIVLGAGAVGVEFADVMATFGAKTTLVEMLPTIVPLEDPDCGAELEKAMRRKKIEILTGHRAAGVERTADGVKVVLENLDTGVKVEREATHMLVAVGRRPVTADVGLDTVGAVVDRRGFIQIDTHMETAEPGLYAIGDIVKTPQLAHLASVEAMVAAGHAAGRPLPPIDYDLVPSCTYSNPEVATVGLSEAEAVNRGHRIKTGSFPFAALGKASILNELNGFVKIVSDAETDRVLGVHMVGPHVTDMIAEACTAMGAAMTTEAWGRIIHPHPTLSEAVLEALHTTLGETVHG